MFIETSAKAGYNVKQLFRRVAAALPGMEDSVPKAAGEDRELPPTHDRSRYFAGRLSRSQSPHSLSPRAHLVRFVCTVTAARSDLHFACPPLSLSLGCGLLPSQAVINVEITGQKPVNPAEAAGGCGC